MLISCDKNLIISAVLGSTPSLSGAYQELHKKGLVTYYDQTGTMKWDKYNLDKLSINALVFIYNLMSSESIHIVELVSEPLNLNC